MLNKIKLFFCVVCLSGQVSADPDSQVPVIFIHKSPSFYLNDSLWQAKQYNERVILISDVKNGSYDGIEQYDIADYFKGASYFATIYKHIAENHYAYELFCFQRWFILKEFMQNKGINRCFYCDSDVMLYCNVTEEEKIFSQCDIVPLISPKGGYSGGISFWRFAGLEHFCLFVNEYYENKKNLEKWIAWFNSPRRKKGQGLCDMTIFKEYAKTLEAPMIDIRTMVDNAVFDHIINSDEEGAYQMNEIEKGRKIKKVEWRGALPYCYNIKEEKWVRFKCFHFQGSYCKNLMHDFRRAKSDF